MRMFGRLLPRLLEIMREINARFLREVAQRWPGDAERQRRMSIIEEGGEQYRAHGLSGRGRQPFGEWRGRAAFAVADSSICSVIFTSCGRSKFNNKTNGVTPRRWMTWSNPEMSKLISQTIGTDWIYRPRPAEKTCATCRRCRLPRAVARGETGKQDSAWRRWCRAIAASSSTPMRCSTCR